MILSPCILSNDQDKYPENIIVLVICKESLWQTHTFNKFPIINTRQKTKTYPNYYNWKIHVPEP